MKVEQLILIFAIINAIGYLCMHLDKKYAIENRKRISEASLITVAAVGGSIGVLIGMYANRHKTRKVLFKYGVPIIMFIQALLVCFLLYILKNHGN